MKMNGREFFAGILFLVSALLGAGAAYAASYSADFSLAQHEASTCPAGGGQLLFATIKNTGTNADSYWLSASRDWVLMPEVTVAPGEEARVGILVAIGDPTVVPGKYSVDLTIHSSKSRNTYKDTITVKTLDCPGVIIQPKAEAFYGCVGEEVGAVILLQNTGNIEDTFEISSTKGVISNKTLALKSKETREIILSLSPAEGAEDVTINAASTVSYAKASEKLTFSGRKCYSSGLSFEPKNTKTCVGDEAAFAVKISNNGERGDVFALSSNIGNLSLSTVEVPANATRTAVLTVVPDKTGTQEIAVEAVSPNARQSAKSTLEAEKCYSFGVSVAPETLRTENYSGLISTVVIRNTGARQDTYTVSLEGTPWMEVSPEQVTVGPNSTKEAYIYITPVFGIENGTYPAKIAVSSGKSKDVVSKELDFTFGSAEKASGAEVPPVTGASTKAISKKVIYALIIGLALVLLILFWREFRKMSKRGETDEEDESDVKRPEKKEKKAGRKGKKETGEDIKDILEGI